jgi:membrane protein implicated in regulation of membrane protease activity
MELLEWYNLVFAAPILLAGVYLVLSATGMSGDHDHDVGGEVDHDVGMHLEHEMDLDHDVDVDQDLDVDQDVDLGADHEVSLEHEVEVEGGLDHEASAPEGLEHEVHEMAAEHGDVSPMLRALSVLGFGKVPVSILVTCLMVIFGVVGLVCNGLFASVLPWQWAPVVYFWPSLAMAIVLSLSLTGVTARALHRLMPTSETYAVRPEQLAGCTGWAVYPLIAGVKGVVDVAAPDGTVCRIAALPLEGDLEKGREVIVTRYHRDGDYYDVTASPL